MSSNYDRVIYSNGSCKVYPVIQEETYTDVQSWTGDTVVSSGNGESHDMADLPPRTSLAGSDSGSVCSVLTEHYLDQIKDREERESARRNIDYLREHGFSIHGKLIDGKYYVKFSTPTGAEVLSIKSFIKAKIRKLLQQ
jgi:hypothetical protein